MVTLSLIFVCFGGYTYLGFKQYLIRALQQTLTRRAHQIATTILADMPEKGENYVSNEIQARYAPELNERIIRITDQSGRAIYASKNAGVLSGLPSVPAGDTIETKQLHREETPQGVLILTARDNITDKVKNFEEGADDYLTKSFSFAELLVRVNEAKRLPAGACYRETWGLGSNSPPS